MKVFIYGEKSFQVKCGLDLANKTSILVLSPQKSSNRLIFINLSFLFSDFFSTSPTYSQTTFLSLSGISIFFNPKFD